LGERGEQVEERLQGDPLAFTRSGPRLAFDWERSPDGVNQFQRHLGQRFDAETVSRGHGVYS
jgi:hypothetical protein